LAESAGKEDPEPDYSTGSKRLEVVKASGKGKIIFAEVSCTGKFIGIATSIQ
jgi:hypothetical protein